MGSSKLCANLWDFVKMFLILYHGQSAIERGFNINKQLLVENLKPESLVALGRIEDRMRYSEQSPETIKVPNKIIQSVKEAHSGYQSELAKHRTEKEDTQKSIKRKIVIAEIKAVKKKGLKLANEISVLGGDADLLVTKAEKLLKFEFLKQVNQKRRIADDK